MENAETITDIKLLTS